MNIESLDLSPHLDDGESGSRLVITTSACELQQRVLVQGTWIDRGSDWTDPRCMQALIAAVDRRCH